jgi:hypothetical protein
MRPHSSAALRQYRVWIVGYRGRPPRGLAEIPPRCWALEPAEDQAMSAREAADYTAAFNGAILAQRGRSRQGATQNVPPKHRRKAWPRSTAPGPRRRRLWAVAVPVTLRYDGDLQPGQGLTQSPQCSR